MEKHLLLLTLPLMLLWARATAAYCDLPTGMGQGVMCFVFSDECMHYPYSNGLAGSERRRS